MCGICGVYDLTGEGNLTHEALKTMAHTMVHRGPDDSGTYLSPDRYLGLGFRRLAVLDLSPAGHQPMSNEDGTVWLVFNGEIYNHAELRSQLEAIGHRYSSRTDSETIVHGYEEWGQEVVEHLRGMFAFAIYDQRERVLFLARDRIGIKPVYYTFQKGCFLFGSEIKAILVWPGVLREVNKEALYHYLTLSVAPAPSTLFQGIQKLPPGHIMIVHANGDSEFRQYWDPLFPDDKLNEIKPAELIEELRFMLRESIRLRMMSDVPFGVFLSGGLDSSLNVALMSKLADRPVDTFSVSICGDPLSDERSQGRRVASHFHTNHHEIVITRQDFVDFLPRMVYHQDEPLADPVCVPLYFVSKLARENGTIVIQVGEGSDELFIGYRDYAFMADFHRWAWRPFARLPGWVKNPLAALATAILPPRRAELLRRAAQGENLFWSGASVFPELAKRNLLRNHDGHNSHRVVAEHYDRFDRARPGASFLDRVIYVELKNRLPELLLMRVDKMTMATSLEARVPYLDHELVRFALSIPVICKYHLGQTKYILKEAARGILPDDVIDRPKTGFCGGASNMLAGELLDYAERVVLNSRWLGEVFDFLYVRPLFREHRSGQRDQGMAIWNLLNLDLWHRQWIEREPLPQ